MKKLIFAIILFSNLMAASTAYACKCDLGIPIEDRYNNAEYVFIGKVLEVENFNRYHFRRWRISTTRDYSAEFQVSRFLKGSGEEIIEVKDGSGGSSCAFFFKEGVEYLVFAKKEEDGDDLTTRDCRGTRELERVPPEDIKKLEAMSLTNPR